MFQKVSSVIYFTISWIATACKNHEIRVSLTSIFSNARDQIDNIISRLIKGDGSSKEKFPLENY